MVTMLPIERRLTAAIAMMSVSIALTAKSAPADSSATSGASAAAGSFARAGARATADRSATAKADPGPAPKAVSASVASVKGGEAAAAADSGAPGRSPLEAALQSYGALLSRYVTPDGVRYAAWRAKPEDVRALGAVVAGLSAVDVASLSPVDRTALFIDLYNARVLQIVLEANPKSSIREVTPGITGFGVFLKPAITLGKESLSLRQLEDRLRETAKDPRIHFAINCASKSCPPIAPEPYRGSTLSAQLDRSTRAFLASPGALVLKEPAQAGGTLTVEASRIFDWYAKDFKAAGGPLAFIEAHAPPAVADRIRAAGKSVKLTAQDYDWSLNAAP